jgi:hypothetical protein
MTLMLHSHHGVRADRVSYCLKFALDRGTSV